VEFVGCQGTKEKVSNMAVITGPRSTANILQTRRTTLATPKRRKQKRARHVGQVREITIKI